MPGNVQPASSSVPVSHPYIVSKARAILVIALLVIALLVIALLVITLLVIAILVIAPISYIILPGRLS